MLEEESISPDVLSLIRYGYHARANRRFAESHKKFIEAIAIARSGKSIPTIGYAMLALADDALWHLPDALDDPWECRRSMCGEALALFESAGEHRGICRAKCMLAAIESDEERACQLCEDAIDIGVKHKDSWVIATATLAKGRVYAMRGKTTQAAPFLWEALDIARQLKDDCLLIQSLRSCALSCDLVVFQPKWHRGGGR